MNSFAEAFRTGGIWMYLLLALALGGAILPFAGTILAALGKRIPLVAWIIVPFIALLIGSLGAAMGMLEVFDALSLATPETRSKLLARGIALSMNVKVFGAMVASFYFAMGALGLGLGTVIGVGKPREWTILPAALSLVFGVLTAGGVIASAVILRDLGPSAATFLLPLGASVLGCALANASTHAEDSKARARTASHRLAAGIMVVFAMLAHGYALEWFGHIQTFEVLEMASPTTRLEVMASGSEVAKQGWYMGIGVAFGAALLGILPALFSIKDAADKRGLIGAAIATVGIVFAGGLMLLAGSMSRGPAESVGQPTEAWRLRTLYKTPSLDQMKELEDVQRWELDLAIGGDDCILHRQEGDWVLSSSFEEGSMRASGACKTDMRPGTGAEGCPSKPGKLDGPICSGLDKVTMLVPSEASVSDLTSHGWGNEPRTFVIALDAHLEHSPGRIDPALGMLLSAAPSGLELTVLPEKSEIGDNADRVIIHKKGTYTIFNGEQRGTVKGLNKLRQQLEQLPPSKNPPVIIPDKTWDMQSLVEVCLAVRMGNETVKERGSYNTRRDARCTILGRSIGAE